jgi:hypothetical protein
MLDSWCAERRKCAFLLSSRRTSPFVFDRTQSIDGNLGVVTGEKSVQQIRKLFRHLPPDHGIANVHIIAGIDSDCGALVKFMAECARRSHFTITVMPLPNPQQMIFNRFFITVERRVKAHGGVSIGWTS